MKTVSLWFYRCLAGAAIFFLFSKHLSAQCTPAQRQADSLLLVSLYNSTNGAAWSNPWNLSQPMNSWAGVGINPQGCVIDLFLGGRGLNGTLPAEIGNLSSISVNFWISGNPGLTGAIPASIGNLSQVKKFILYGNGLTGPIPASVGGMTSVVEFDACCNQLTGPLPSTFGNLDNLKSLVLNNNQINGPIPSTLNEMGALTSLWIGGNQLTGTIPATIGAIPNLTILYLPNNNLSGCIPSELRALCPKVTYGHIFNNPQLSTQSWQNFCSSGEGECVCPVKLNAFLPGQNAIGVNYINSVFEWEKADGPSHTVTYDLSVKDLQGNLAFPEQKNLTTNRFTYSGNLTPSKTYKWTVKVKVDNSMNVISEEMTFTTHSSYVSIITPPDNIIKDSLSFPSYTKLNGYRAHWNNTQIYPGRLYDSCLSSGNPTCNNSACNCDAGIVSGVKWQCVEFINRYFKNYHAINLGKVIKGKNAIEYANLSNFGLQFFPNNNPDTPRVGDIVVWEGNSGHVAIIKAVNQNTIEVAQQNTLCVFCSYSLTKSGNNYTIGKFDSGTRACLGWVRPVPRIIFPIDGQTVSINPTFLFESKQNPIHQLKIYQRNLDGCYQPFYLPLGQIHSNSYVLPSGNLLQPDTEYRAHLETTLKGPGTEEPAVIRSRPVFFRTGYFSTPEFVQPPITLGCDTTSHSLQFITYKSGTNPPEPVRCVRIYGKSDDQWRDIGSTDDQGHLFISDLNPGLSTNDSIIFSAHGFSDGALRLTPNMLKEGVMSMPLFSLGDTNLIVNASVLPWENNAPMTGLFTTQSDIELKVTAEHHDQYHLIITTEVDDSVNVQTYPATQELLSVSLLQGFNSLYFMFTNASDTVYKSIILYYFPINDLGLYTYNVMIQSDSLNSGASLYVNGAFLKILSGQSELITVPDIRCSFVFNKPGYTSFTKDVYTQDTIEVLWSPYIPTPEIVYAAPKVLLQGPYISAQQLMHDSLRVKNLIPLTEPYTGLSNFTHIIGGGETTTTDVLAVTGPDAIVDWVFLELRSPANPAQVLATRSALLQRDGDVVDVDGASPVVFGAPADQEYYLTVRHRNHLGAQLGMESPYPICEATTKDFTTLPPEGFYAHNGLSSAQRLISGTYTLWAGNGRIDPQLKYNGSNNDRTAILSVVGLATPNASIPGYRLQDYNLDGVVKYNGAANDRNVLLGNVGITTPSAVVEEQVAR